MMVLTSSTTRGQKPKELSGSINNVALGFFDDDCYCCRVASLELKTSKQHSPAPNQQLDCLFQYFKLWCLPIKQNSDSANPRLCPSPCLVDCQVHSCCEKSDNPIQISLVFTIMKSKSVSNVSLQCGL